MTREISGELAEAMRYAGFQNSSAEAWAAVATAQALERIADSLEILANRG